MHKVIPWVATAIFIAMYFGFILGAANSKSAFAEPAFAGGVVSVGLLLGIAMTAGTLLLVGGYIIYLNSRSASQDGLS